MATLYVCYFSHLGAIGFVGPDEPRYAWIARDMLESGDWVTPRLYGKPWFEKPVLYYWGAALSFKLFGVSEAAARLPSAVCALLATLAIAWLAWRVYGAETARWLLLLLPTTVGMIGFSHSASTDMPFSGMLTIAMVCAAVVLGLRQTNNALEDAGAFTKRRQPTSRELSLGRRTPWFALILFGFFLGLAVLAKGPAAIILSGGAVFFWALFTKRWKDAFRLLHPVAIASFLATALPWYVLCAQRNPDFFRVFIIEHNFKRFLTPEFQHIQPFWYYVPILLIAFFPWTFAIVAAAAGLRRFASLPSLHPVAVLLLCWSAFCMLFFTISKSKLPGYILPLLPAAALLFVLALASSDAKVRRMTAICVLIGGVTYLTIGALIRGSIVHGPPKLADAVLYAAFVFVSWGMSNLLLGSSILINQARGIREGMVFVGLLATLFPLAIAPVLIDRSGVWAASSDWVAVELRSQGVPPDQLRVLNLKRDRRYALNFYLHREIEDWNETRLEDGYVLANGQYCSQLKTDQMCVDLWRTRDFRDGAWALLRVTPRSSPNGSTGGGKVH